jgi:hypothetical protein
VVIVTLGVLASCQLVGRWPDATYESGTATVEVSGGETRPTGTLDFVEGTYYRVPADDDGLVGARAAFKSDDGWHLYLERFGSPAQGRNEVFLGWRSDEQGANWWNVAGGPEDCTYDLADDFSVGLTGTIACTNLTVIASDDSDGDRVDLTVEFQAKP